MLREMSNLEFTALKVLQQRKSLLHQHKRNREAVKEFDNYLYILYVSKENHMKLIYP